MTDLTNTQETALETASEPVKVLAKDMKEFIERISREDHKTPTNAIGTRTVDEIQADDQEKYEEIVMDYAGLYAHTTDVELEILDSLRDTIITKYRALWGNPPAVPMAGGRSSRREASRKSRKSRKSSKKSKKSSKKSSRKLRR
jgi:hypothetical protein